MSSEISLPKLTSDERRCTGCGEIKGAADYYPRREGKRAGRLRPQCKSCYAAAAARRHRASPHKSRERHLKASYGLSAADYHGMLVAQEGRCAICATSEPGSRGWHVDHDHLKLRVRALLCHKCNLGIGHFSDIPEMLERAAAYLRLHDSAH